MEFLLRQGQYEKVLATANAKLQQKPGSPEMLYWKAQALGFMAHHLEALAIFRDLTRAHSSWADAWYGAGVASSQLGLFDDALKYYEHAYKFDPHHPSHAYNLGQYLIADPKRWEEGLGCLRDADRLGHPKARKAIAEAQAARPYIAL